MYDGPGVRILVFLKDAHCVASGVLILKDNYENVKLCSKRICVLNCGDHVSVCPVGIHTMSKGLKHEVDHSIDCLGCRK